MLGRIAQQRIGPSQNFNLALELANPAFGFTQFAGLRSRNPFDLNSVYPILLHSTIKAAVSDPQVLGRLRDRMP